MLIYLAFLVVGANALLEAEGVKRLAWNMDILCRDFKDAVEWYPEHEPPKDTHETKERINRVTYGAVWRAMPALRTGEARKEQYGEEWWQWMSSSWNQRIPYATLGIKTGEEYARREGESWEEYQKRMSKMFAGVEFVAKVSPAALPMLQQQMGNLALTFDGPVGLIKGTESSMTMQNNRTFKLKDFASYPGWLSMGESLMEAVAGMNPEDLGPWQAIKIDKVNIASLSSKDIMKRNPDAIAAYTALQSLTGNMDGGPTLRFNEDGQLVEFATGQLVNFNDDTEESNSEDQPVPNHTPEQVQQRLIEMQTIAGNLLYQQTGIKSINIIWGHRPNAANWCVVSMDVNMETNARKINMCMPSEKPGMQLISVGKIDIRRFPRTIKRALEGLARIEAPVSHILLKNPGDDGELYNVRMDKNTRMNVADVVISSNLKKELDRQEELQQQESLSKIPPRMSTIDESASETMHIVPCMSPTMKVESPEPTTSTEFSLSNEQPPNSPVTAKRDSPSPTLSDINDTDLDKPNYPTRSLCSSTFSISDDAFETPTSDSSPVTEGLKSSAPFRPEKYATLPLRDQSQFTLV